MTAAQLVCLARSSSRSRANSRIVSSIVKRGSPSGSSSCRSRLWSTRRSSPSRTSRIAVPIRLADRLGRLERRSRPTKTASARNSALLGCVEQVVAPGDRVAQRLLPRRQVARAAGQQRQALLQARQQRLRGEQLDPRRGQLDRQRQAVEAAQISATAGAFSLVEGEVGLDRLRPLDEQRDRLVLRAAASRRLAGRLGSGSASGGTGILVLAAQTRSGTGW